MKSVDSYENPLTASIAVTILGNVQKIRPAKTNVVDRRRIAAFG